MKKSHIYSANNLGKFANTESIPSEKEVADFIDEVKTSDPQTIEISEEAFHRYHLQKNYKYMLKTILTMTFDDIQKKKHFIELTAKCALEKNDNSFAWKTAMSVPLLIP